MVCLRRSSATQGPRASRPDRTPGVRQALHGPYARRHPRDSYKRGNLCPAAARTQGQVITASVVVTALWFFIVAIFTLILQRRAVRNQNRLVDSLVHEREVVGRSSEWRARLLAMLAHDFKSQLTVLIGASHLLEDFPQRRADVQRLASLRNASYALAEMADNAILLARAQERRSCSSVRHSISGRLSRRSYSATAMSASFTCIVPIRRHSCSRIDRTPRECSTTSSAMPSNIPTSRFTCICSTCRTSSK